MAGGDNVRGNRVLGGLVLLAIIISISLPVAAELRLRASVRDSAASAQTVVGMLLDRGRDLFVLLFQARRAVHEREGMLERFVRPDWVVSNDLCEGCAGTQYYSRDQSWSFLDMVVFAPSENADSAWQVRSVEIANQLPAQVTAEGTPNRYRSAERTGVSDHWPVLMTLEPRP